MSHASDAIVLIDPDSARRFERTIELNALGHRVHALSDGSLAGAVASAETVAAFVVDEDSGGFDLCFELKTNPKTWEVPVVLLVSLATALKKPPTAHGPDHILAMPMRPDYLAAEVARFLGRDGSPSRIELQEPVPGPARAG